MPNTNNNNKNDGVEDSLKHIVTTIFGTNDYTNNYIEKERDENKVMAFLSYVIPPLPFLVERTSKYVIFHSNQGMNNLVYLIICLIIAWILNVAFNNHSYIDIFQKICLVIYFVWSAIGMLNAFNNTAKEIPIASKFNWINLISDIIGK